MIADAHTWASDNLGVITPAVLFIVAVACLVSAYIFGRRGRTMRAEDEYFAREDYSGFHRYTVEDLHRRLQG